MKNFILYTCLIALLFFFGNTAVSAQGPGKKDKQRKEYYKQREKDRKSYYKDRDKERKDYLKYSKKRHKQYSKSSHKRNGPPHWAPAHGYRAKHHVYFRDYYTFYDPYRGGYVYRHNSGWRFSPSVPVFLANVDLGKARVQLLTDIPLNQHPERYYNRYSKRYPRDSRININISLF